MYAAGGFGLLALWILTKASLIEEDWGSLVAVVGGWLKD